MKRMVAIFLSLLTLLLVAPVWETASADENTPFDPDDAAQATPESTGADTVPGFLISDEEFFSMVDAFFQADLAGTLSSVTLTETQTLAFNPERTDHLMPALAVTVTEAEPFKANADSVAATVGSLVGVMQYLQEQFPDSFLFNNDMAAPYMEAGLSYAVAETDIWLWPESTASVLLPVCFYENENRSLVDCMYLLEVTLLKDGSLRYILYNNPQYVADYMTHVTVSSERSPFQQALVLWYIQNFSQSAAENANDPELPNFPQNAAENANDPELPIIGTAIVRSGSANVRSSNTPTSSIVANITKGEEYPVFAVTEKGWLLIRCADGVTGYVHPNLVTFIPK